MASDHSLLVTLLGKVKQGNLVLPSLPQVAINVRNLAVDPDCKITTLVNELNKDPALAARIVALANSAVFSGRVKTTSVTQAVTRLGLARTRELVTAAAVQQMFRSSRSMTWDLMDDLWRSNVEVTACAVALLRAQQQQGQLLSLDVDTLMLACLVHNIGALPVLEAAELEPELFEEKAQLKRVVHTLRAPIGRSVLEAWGFDQSLVEVVHRWSEPCYQTQEPSYLDLVRFAAIYTRELILPDPLVEVLKPYIEKGVIPGMELFGSDAYFEVYSQTVASFQTTVRPGSSPMSASAPRQHAMA